MWRRVSDVEQPLGKPRAYFYRLRWQTLPYLTGYDYKNSIANGIYFNIGARLTRYTGNESYATLGIRSYNWVKAVGLMDAEFKVYDGAHIGQNCTDINKVQFSYNVAVFLHGAAVMFNHVSLIDNFISSALTISDKWGPILEITS